MLSHHDRVAGLVIFVFSAGALAWTFTFPDSAIGHTRMVTGSMALLSLILFFRSFSEAERDKAFEPFMRNPARFAIGLGMTVAYVLACEYIGYYTASAVFIPAAAWVLGLRRPYMVSITTVVYCVMIYFVFEILFERPLPMEIWMTWFVS